MSKIYFEVNLTKFSNFSASTARQVDSSGLGRLACQGWAGWAGWLLVGTGGGSKKSHFAHNSPTRALVVTNNPAKHMYASVAFECNKPWRPNPPLLKVMADLRTFSGWLSGLGWSAWPARAGPAGLPGCSSGLGEAQKSLIWSKNFTNV